jgi:hypothetical protein
MYTYARANENVDSLRSAPLVRQASQAAASQAAACLMLLSVAEPNQMNTTVMGNTVDQGPPTQTPPQPHPEQLAIWKRMCTHTPVPEGIACEWQVGANTGRLPSHPCGQPHLH